MQLALGNSGKKQSTPPDANIDLFLRIAVIWHVLVTVGAVVGLVFVWRSADMALWLRIVVTAVLLLTGIVSGTAVPPILRREHQGRFQSLIVNYLGFLAAFIGALHYLGIFIGIDALANTFGRGLLYLSIVLIGFLIQSAGDRHKDNPKRQQAHQRIGKIVMLAGLTIFLIVVGIIPGTIALVSRLNNLRNIALVLAAALFGTMAGLMWRGKVAIAMREKSQDSEALNGYLFLSPNLLGFLLFFAGPLLLSLYVSFTDSDAFGQQNWIGLQNYGEIFNLDIARLDNPDQLANEVIDITVYDELARFTIFSQSYVIGAQDKLFWIALRNTLVFVITAVPLSVIPALLLSTVLNSKVPGMKLFRTIYFLPSIAAVVGVALIWRWLYNSTVGWINYFIAGVVAFINQIAGAGTVIDPQIGWLSDTDVALFAVVIIAAWQWMGFNTVLYLAGLQNIPKSLYEAATVDGAGAITQFFRITIPLLAPTTFFVVTTTTIQAMQIFDQVFVLTTPPGGPGTSTTTIVLYLYNQGFRNFRQGYASAIAWVLFLLIFGLTILQFQRQRSETA
ncbi:MAG: sugar ABC transporter permease [Ardenticatenaceae bacterium]|nr:sugar ABC transporter permease [Ardenticatenaceae bacterium]MCB9444872.1 sugar ABC transporter permease [Ardenticatenaceae bacterium]